MTREDKPRGGADSGFAIDTSVDSRRVQSRRPRRKPSYLPVILLALATIASIVAFLWVLNRPPEKHTPANEENTQQLAHKSAPKANYPAKASTKEKRPKRNATRKKPTKTADKITDIIPEKEVKSEEPADTSPAKPKFTKPDGERVDAMASDDIELQLGANVDNSGLSDAPDEPADKKTVAQNKPASGNKEADAGPGADEAVLELYESGRLLVPKSYRELRAIHARDFSEKHADDIALAFRKDHESMSRWLDENVDIKEELYLALDPERDNIVSALGLFRDLKKQFPKRFPAYGELAIATAVVWDNGGRGVYDFGGHQRRTQSKLPPNRVGAIENFKYLVDAEKMMGGRVRFLPWEFLVHAVNHRTAIDERKWALANYVQKRIGFGKCYHDVPYDHGMLKGQPPQLTGKSYTLDNIRRFGGVCAMQADFANRVGKSLGVPTEYISGESRSGDRHAWVMWVELMGVSKGKVAFELKSHGRYRGDRYYVGHLTDSHTGRRITDRQLELRLHTVGLNPQNKRHAALVMKSFATLRDKTQMSVVDQIHFLHNVMQLSPGNEQAWLALAAMTRDGKVDKSHARKMTPLLDQLFITFAKFPDFTWQVFNDLIAYHDSPKQKNLLYERLVNLYVQAKRPDLACRAVLKYTDNLAAEDKGRQAIAALASTIMVFPDEGRFVPKMLDAVEALCPKVAGSDKQLIAFYQLLLPKIPQRRGKTPQPYCIAMYKRGIAFFEKSGHAELAGPWRVALAKLEADLQ